MKSSLPDPAPVGLTVAAFTARYGVSRTRVFGEIKAGRLEARKAGRVTLIPVEAGDAWFNALSLRKAG